MRRDNNLWPLITSRDNIATALINAASGVRKRGPVIQCLEHFDKTVEDVRQLLLDGAFHTGKYKERVIVEPKRRIIHMLPFFPDRIVHHALVDVLGPRVWEPRFIFDSYACRVGKGSHRAVARATRFVRQSKFAFKYDIRGFYHSIDHAVLKELICRTIKDENALAVLFDIIDSFHDSAEGRGCPIGNLTSQWFGNVYLNSLDHFAKDRLGIARYVRYCDDFHVFGDGKAEMREWDERLAEHVCYVLKLEFSKRELSRTKDGCDFLGYRIFPEKTLLRKSTAKRVKRRLAGIRRVLERGEGLNETRLLSLMGSVASARGVFKHARTHNLAESIGLDNLWKEINGRYQDIFVARNTRSA